MPDGAQLPIVREPIKRLEIFFGDDGQKCGHLFAAVLEHAFREIFVPQANTDGNKEHSRYESIRLLTATTGEWAAHRNWLCTCAGIDGDALAHKVREMLVGRREVYVRPIHRVYEDAGRMMFKQHQIDKAHAVYAELLAQENARRTTTPRAKLPRIVESVVVLDAPSNPLAPPAEIDLPDHQLPATAADARRIGSKFYMTEKPCKHGHISKRRTTTSSCLTCERIAQEAFAAKVRASK